MAKKGDKCYVHLGRFGDLMILLPGWKKEFDDTGKKPVVMVAEEFSSLTDGVSYIQPWVEPLMFCAEARKAKAMAESQFEKVVFPRWWDIGNPPPVLPGKPTVKVLFQGKEFLMEAESCYQSSQWRLAGFDDSGLCNWPLVFDRRDARRETALAESVFKTTKPKLLLNFTSVTSPFGAMPEILDAIQPLRSRFEFVDIGKVRAERIYDLLGLFDRAAAMITADTATLHLAAAGRIPYIALQQDAWRGSIPKGNCILSVRYSGAEKHGGEIFHKLSHLNSVKPSSEMSSGPRWEAMLDRMRTVIPKFDSSLAAIHYAQSSLNFDHRAPANDVTAPLCSTALANEFPEFAYWLSVMGDSHLSWPQSLIQFGDVKVSNVFYYHLRYVMTCLRYVKKPFIVCEIGGGYGGPARLWMTNPTFAPETYFIIDFPESLFFAEVFLRESLPKCSIHYVTDEEFPNAQIVLCPISRVKELERFAFDLVINTGSMQEMSEAWVDFWMEWIDRQECHHFYSLNYFSQPLANMAESGNTWSPRLSSRWSYLMERFNPSFTQLQSARNFADILAVKDDFGARPVKLAGPFDGQTFLMAMNGLTRNLNDDYCWECLRYALSAKGIPKEAYWLANHLTEHASHNFRANRGRELSAIMARLIGLRKSGSESVYV